MSEQKDPAYPPERPYPTQPSAPSYPQQQNYPPPPPPGYPVQGYPAQGYPQTGYPQHGYPQQQQQGHTTQTYVPQAIYTPQGQVTIKTGAPQHQVMVRETNVQPSDFLCFSVFVMLFCCLPFGIIALIKSMDVRSLVAVQDFAAASRASKSAKNWNVAGLVTGLIIEVVMVIILIVWFVVFANQQVDRTYTILNDFGNSVYDNYYG